MTVTPSAPLPVRTGTIALGPPYWGSSDCEFASAGRPLQRDVFVQLAPEVAPWVDLASIGPPRDRYFTGHEPVMQFTSSGMLSKAEVVPGFGTFVGPENPSGRACRLRGRRDREPARAVRLLHAAAARMFGHTVDGVAQPRDVADQKFVNRTPTPS